MLPNVIPIWIVLISINKYFSSCILSLVYAQEVKKAKYAGPKGPSRASWEGREWGRCHWSTCKVVLCVWSVLGPFLCLAACCPFLLHHYERMRITEDHRLDSIVFLKLKKKNLPFCCPLEMMKDGDTFWGTVSQAPWIQFSPDLGGRQRTVSWRSPCTLEGICACKQCACENTMDWQNASEVISPLPPWHLQPHWL